METSLKEFDRLNLFKPYLNAYTVQSAYEKILSETWLNGVTSDNTLLTQTKNTVGAYFTFYNMLIKSYY